MPKPKPAFTTGQAVCLCSTANRTDKAISPNPGVTGLKVVGIVDHDANEVVYQVLCSDRSLIFVREVHLMAM